MAPYNTGMEKLQLCRGLTGKMPQCYNLFAKKLRKRAAAPGHGAAEGLREQFCGAAYIFPDSTAGSTIRGSMGCIRDRLLLGKVAHKSERRHAGKASPANVLSDPLVRC